MEINPGLLPLDDDDAGFELPSSRAPVPRVAGGSLYMRSGGNSPFSLGADGSSQPALGDGGGFGAGSTFLMSMGDVSFNNDAGGGAAQQPAATGHHSAVA